MLAVLITAPWERHNVATGVNPWINNNKQSFSCPWAVSFIHYWILNIPFVHRSPSCRAVDRNCEGGSSPKRADSPTEYSPGCKPMGTGVNPWKNIKKQEFSCPRQCPSLEIGY